MPRWSLPGPYGAHNFRSHTEGKWAIFWDELGVKWEYEPQGFVTDGSAYLPDFTVFAAGPLWMVCLCIKALRLPWRVHLAQVLVYGLGWLLIFLAARCDPTTFTEWFRD